MSARHSSSSKGSFSALAISVLLHALLIALLVFSGVWKQPPKRVLAAGEPIEAMLMLGELPSSKAAKQASARAASKPRPKPPVSQPPAAKPQQPKPSPKPEQAKQPPQPKPQTQVPKPDVVAQQKAAELAKKKEAEKLKKAQEEKRRQEQILLEEKKKQEEAEQKERLAEQQKKEAREKERQEKLAKLEEIRKKKADLEAKRKREEARLQQMADANARAAEDRRASDNDGTVGSPPPGNGGTDTALQGRYVAMIAQKVTQSWLRPDSARPGIVCKVRIAQIPGGEVIRANVVSPCNADPLTQRSIEAAVLKAQPLPHQGFESVFNPDIIFTFRYDG